MATFPRLKELLSECHLEGKVAITTPGCANDVLADPRVTAILVCTPAPHHEALIEAALAAGAMILNYGKCISLSNKVTLESYE
ncbi:uncharacterized protein LOC135468987 isoform X2 [Liolophura sinensis]|uniref:uncharacterized protein LOC135468987 isoform X2 n=1 Tax=Liolophura sinensis TaxID=3198878 RepID=UPI0031593705